MGKRGPNKMPTNILLLEGSHRGRSRAKTEVKPPTGPVECPAWLPDEARAEWDRLAPALTAMGLLTVCDVAGFATYCASWAHYVDACEHIKAEGTISKGSKRQDRISPWVQIRQMAADSILKFGREYGLTPASRANLKIDPPAEDDPLEVWQKSQRIQPGGVPRK